MSNYTIYVLPTTWKEIKKLPGNIRQRVKQIIDQLANDPRPPKSKVLNVSDVEYELR